MKYILLLFLSFSTLSAFCQTEVKTVKKKKNIIKLGLPAILVSSLALSYERELNEKSSFQVQTNFTATDFGTTQNTGFILTGEYRYYPKKEGFVGFYVSPYLRYNYILFDANQRGSFNKLNGVAVGLLLGKKWHIGKICLDLFAGPQLGTAKLKYADSSLEDEFAFRSAYNGVGLRAGFAIGIIF